jgi:hypothetical protein
MPEERHIADIAFGLFSLRHQKIDFKDIFLVIDGEDDGFIRRVLATNECQIYKSFELPSLLNFGYDNLVLFVTGHGGIEGIDSNPPIVPYGLLSNIRNSTSIKNAILYLGQCYAGIFHYLNVVKRDENDKTIIIVGATNLFNSISGRLQLPRVDNSMYIAQYNLFLTFLFIWIARPVDVDGDGRFTVTDSYKYASANANMFCKDFKVLQSNLYQYRLMREIYNLEESLKTSGSLLDKVILDGKREQYKQILDMQFNHQESWMLNAIPALDIEIK